MSEFHIEFDDQAALDLDIEDIETEADIRVLCEWYIRAETLIDEIKDMVDYNRFIEHATDEWLWRCGRKIAYLRRGVRRIEQRILRLGGMPPYRLDDGRATFIRGLEKKLAQAKEALLSNNMPLPWKDAGKPQ